MSGLSLPMILALPNLWEAQSLNSKTVTKQQAALNQIHVAIRMLNEGELESPITSRFVAVYHQATKPMNDFMDCFDGAVGLKQN